MFRGITRQESYVLIGVCFVSFLGIVFFAYKEKNRTVVEYESKPSAPIVIPNITSELPEDSSQNNSNLQETSSAFQNGILNINIATLEDLETLPGIGPKKAESILAYRTENGPFLSVENITSVPGIGDKTLESLKLMITVGEVSFLPSTDSSSVANETIQSSEINSNPEHYQIPGGAQNPQPIKNEKIRINFATFEDLQQLNGVGPATAKKILIDRQLNGPYKNLNDLQRVKGIGPKTVENFRDHIRFD